MKKALVLALATLVAAVGAAPALAGEFAYGGFMRYRYIPANPGTLTSVFGSTLTPDDAANVSEYRIRQFFTFTVNDHVTTNVKFEWNSQFGNERVLGGGAGDLQFGQGVNELQFRVKHAFLRFDVPGVPVTLIVGQQDFSTPKALISVEDGAGVKAIVTAFGAESSLWWQRLIRGGNNQTGADDADWFAFAPVFTLAGIKLSPHVSYVVVGTNAGAGALQALSGDQLTKVTGLQGSRIWFFGVDGSGKLGPVGFTADAVFQRGSDLKAGAGNCPAATRCALFSYIVDVSATFDVGPAALTLKALYSPGDDAPGNARIGSWVDVVSSELGWSPFFHDGSSNSAFFGLTVPGVANGGIIAAGAEIAFSPVKTLSVKPNAYYLRAAEGIDTAAPGVTLEEFYGIEVGVQANWKVWDAVSFLAQFDYIFAGDVFEDATGHTGDAWRAIIGPSISW